MGSPQIDRLIALAQEHVAEKGMEATDREIGLAVSGLQLAKLEEVKAAVCEVKELLKPRSNATALGAAFGAGVIGTGGVAAALARWLGWV